MTLCEHWLWDGEVEFYTPRSYVIGDIYYRNNYIHGGAAVFVHENTNFYKLDVSKFCIDKVLELAAVILTYFKILENLVFRRRPSVG